MLSVEASLTEDEQERRTRAARAGVLFRCFQISEECKDVLQRLEGNILFATLDTFLLENEDLVPAGHAADAASIETIFVARFT